MRSSARKIHLNFHASLPRVNGSQAGEGHHEATGQIPLNVLRQWRQNHIEQLLEMDQHWICRPGLDFCSLVSVELKTNAGGSQNEVWGSRARNTWWHFGGIIFCIEFVPRSTQELNFMGMQGVCNHVTRKVINLQIRRQGRSPRPPNQWCIA